MADLKIPPTDRIFEATKEAKLGGCQLVDLITWGTQGWERVAELEAESLRWKELCLESRLLADDLKDEVNRLQNAYEPQDEHDK